MQTTFNVSCQSSFFDSSSGLRYYKYKQATCPPLFIAEGQPHKLGKIEDGHIIFYPFLIPYLFLPGIQIGLAEGTCRNDTIPPPPPSGPYLITCCLNGG